MNSTTRLQGPNNREELRNTHCCSDCHTLQIINCQGSCQHPHIQTPSTLIFFFFLHHLLCVSLLLLGGVMELVRSLITYRHILAVFIHEQLAISENSSRRQAWGRMVGGGEGGGWVNWGGTNFLTSPWYGLRGVTKQGLSLWNPLGWEGGWGIFKMYSSDTTVWHPHSRNRVFN